MKTTRLIQFDEDDIDLVEGVAIDNRQAIEMAETYSNILFGVMDAFSSVTSNNLNVVMKRLTVISLVMAVPTLITSFYGMNIPLPLANAGWIGTTIVTSACLVTALGSWFLFEGHSTKIEKTTRKLQQRKKHRQKLVART